MVFSSSLLNLSWYYIFNALQEKILIFFLICFYCFFQTLLYRPLSVLSQQLCTVFFHIFLGYKNTLFWSDHPSWWCKCLFAYSMLSLSVLIFWNVNLLFVNSIKQLVTGLLFAISNFHRTTDSILVVILLKGETCCFSK